MNESRPARFQVPARRILFPSHLLLPLAGLLRLPPIAIELSDPQTSLAHHAPHAGRYRSLPLLQPLVAGEEQRLRFREPLLSRQAGAHQRLAVISLPASRTRHLPVAERFAH